MGPELGAYTRIASDYAFRTEQSTVTSLSHLARAVASETGSVEVCNVSTHTFTGQLQAVLLKWLAAPRAGVPEEGEPDAEAAPFHVSKATPNRTVAPIGCAKRSSCDADATTATTGYPPVVG